MRCRRQREIAHGVADGHRLLGVAHLPLLRTHVRETSSVATTGPPWAPGRLPVRSSPRRDASHGGRSSTHASNGFFHRPRPEVTSFSGSSKKEQATTVRAPHEALASTNLLEKPRQESQVAAATVSATDLRHRGSIRHSMEVASLPGRTQKPSFLTCLPSPESSGSRVRSA